MLLTFLIVFRESLEAFLLVGVLIAYLVRLEAARKVVWIVVGSVAGILASVLAAFVLQVLVDQFHNQLYRTILSVGLMVFAVLILSYMALWMGRQAQAHVADVQTKLAGHVTSGRVFGIAALAFISVAREGLETVLFLSALAYSGQPLSLGGGLLGLAVPVALVWVLLATTRKVPVGVFFRATSLLLIVIAAGLFGSAINQAQGIGLDLGSLTPLFDLSGVLPDTTGLGIFLRGLFGYNATPTLAQFVGWAAYLAVAVWLWSRQGRRA